MDVMALVQLSSRIVSRSGSWWKHRGSVDFKRWVVIVKNRDEVFRPSWVRAVLSDK